MIMAICSAHSHGHFHFAFLQIPFRKTGIRGNDVVKRSEVVNPSRLNINAEIFGMPIDRRQQPEEEIRREECFSVLKTFG